MASQAISILIEAQDSASKTIAGVAENVRSASSKITESTRAVASSSDEGAAGAGRFGSALGDMGRMVTGVAIAFATYQIGRTISDFATNAVTTAASLQQTNMAFQSLIGNTQEANKVFGELVQYANTTPFESKDIIQASQTLMGFGTAGQQTVDIIKQLGDVVSVSGGDLNRLSLVTGQVFSQGKMRAQDMYQLINDGGAGVLKIMAANAGGMKKLTDEFESGGIPAKQYFDAIKQATEQGGFAFQGALRQADTFNGRLSTLKDATTQFGMALIGVRIDPALGLTVDKGGVFDRLSKMFVDMLPMLNQLRDGIEGTSESFSKTFGPTVKEVADALLNRFLPAIQQLVSSPFVHWIGEMLTFAIQAAGDELTHVIRATSDFIRTAKDGTSVLIGLTAGFVAYKTITIAVTAVTKLQELAQSALNKAMRLNPYALLASAAIGIVAAYIDVINTTNRSKDATERLNEARKQEVRAADAAKDAENRLQDAQLNAQDAALRVKEAQRNYNDALAQYGPKSLEAQRAALELKRAQYDLRDANDAAKKATDDNARAQTDFAKAKQSVVDANAAIRDSAYGARDGFQAMANAARDATKQAQAGNTAKANQTIVNSLKLPQFGHALGTNFAPGGLTWVGENGPELVNMPTGAKVHNAKDSAAMAGGDTTINITGNITIESPEAAQAFWDRIDKTHRLSRLGMGVA